MAKTNTDAQNLKITKQFITVSRADWESDAWSTVLSKITEAGAIAFIDNADTTYSIFAQGTTYGSTAETLIKSFSQVSDGTATIVADGINATLEFKGEEATSVTVENGIVKIKTAKTDAGVTEARVTELINNTLENASYATTDDLDAKQNVLTAGDHIIITDDIVSAYGYATQDDITSALNGYATEAYVTTALSSYATQSHVTTELAKKQDTLTAGAYVSITDNTIGTYGLATESYVYTAIAKVIDGAPEAYDTLKEIAYWITQDPRGATYLVARVTDLTRKVDDATTGLAPTYARANSAYTLADEAYTLAEAASHTKTTVEAGTANGTISVDGGADITIYTHPAATTYTAAAVKVGNDNLGHVVIGDALTADDITYTTGTSVKSAIETINANTKTGTISVADTITTDTVFTYTEGLVKAEDVAKALNDYFTWGTI